MLGDGVEGEGMDGCGVLGEGVLGEGMLGEGMLGVDGGEGILGELGDWQAASSNTAPSEGIHRKFRSTRLSCFV